MATIERARIMETAVARRGAIGIAIAMTLLLAGIALSPTAAGARRGAFNVDCPFSHSAPDDPIVAPRAPGASHLHDFFANRTTRHDSTYTSMLAGSTTCRVRDDKAGYWSPTAYLNGSQIVPRSMQVYYFGVANRTVETIPPDLQMIAGQKDAASPQQNPRVAWFCGKSSPVAPHPYDCRPYAGPGVDGVVGRVDFPSCWNGAIPARPGDLAYPASKTACPEAFPRRIAVIRFRIHFGVMDPCAGATPCTPTDTPEDNIALSLSSGPYYTLHADFWNTWRQPRLDDLVATCLNAHVKCGELRA
jgi:hypothetical protein